MSPLSGIGKQPDFYDFLRRFKYRVERKFINDIAFPDVLIKDQGAYTKSISISPEVRQICNINNVILIPV